MNQMQKKTNKGFFHDLTLIKFFKTLCLCMGFFSLGLCVAVIGPTMPTLAYNLQVHISTLSFIVPARAAGYLLGSIVSGLIYEKFDSNLLIFFSVFTTACGTLVIPFFNHVVLIAIAMCIVGVTMGFLDTAGNVMCLQTWGDNSGPYLQSLHFSFAIGTTVAPLVAFPFIMKVDDDNMNSMANTETSSTNSFTIESSTIFTVFERFYSVSYVFICCAVIGLMVSFCFLYLGCFHRNTYSDQKNTVKEEGSLFRLKMLSLLFFFFFVYVGMEVTFGVYIYTFAIESENNYSKSQATALNTLFWGLFAVGRFIAIPTSKLISPTKFLIFDLVGTFTAAVVLACFPLYAKIADFIFWIVVGLYGFSLASIFPTGITWAEQYITVTGKAAMVLVVGAASGEMILPFVVGQYIESMPMFLMYFGVAATCVSIILFVFLQLLAKTKGKRLKSISTVEVDEEQKEENECIPLDKFND